MDATNTNTSPPFRGTKRKKEGESNGGEIIHGDRRISDNQASASSAPIQARPPPPWPYGTGIAMQAQRKCKSKKPTNTSLVHEASRLVFELTNEPAMATQLQS